MTQSTIDLTDGSTVTVTVQHAYESYWTGTIGSTSGEFSYGVQQDAPCTVERDPITGTVTIAQVTITQVSR